MITITGKCNCCGCEACAQVCIQNCISFIEDGEGFLYPIIDKNKCINCKACEIVCPVINQEVEGEPIVCYAAKSTKDEIRSKSSSGGLFTEIASRVISEGGVVFGALFNKNWAVIHDSTDCINGLSAFQGSKYVQSRIGNSYIRVRDYLRSGKKVLFSGTPCQVSALRRFLHKEYENLITADFACHGVPSPKIWREYLSKLPINDISSVVFRDKLDGWRGYRLSLFTPQGERQFSEKATRNQYLRAFVNGLTIRPSCFSCPVKNGKSGSDITLADFWGIEHVNPSIDDNGGVSLVLCNSSKGKELVDSLEIIKFKVDYWDSIKYNSSLVRSAPIPLERASFWKEYERRGVDALIELKRPSILHRILIVFKNRIK